MKSVIFAAVAAILPGFTSGQACNADNCLRGLKVTSRPGLEDCKSYLRTTITPATSYVHTRFAALYVLLTLLLAAL
jgi:hypothetical protein